MHMIVSSLGSLFMKHRFFLFHTPIIALGKVFSTTCHYIHYALSLKYLLRLENHEGMSSVRGGGHVWNTFWAQTVINLQFFTINK